MKIKFLVILSIFIGSGFVIPVYATVKRPPQFIILSYDNCTQLKRWQELVDFIERTKRIGNNIRFTFFVSGTNLLTDINKNLYQGPSHKPGEAEIPFGGSAPEVTQRIDFINKLYRDGNEFGSHAVGHFDGSEWSVADWEQEFASYRQLFTDFANNNGPITLKPAYPVSEIVGFRAPYLAKNPALYQTLQNNHFRYDSSGIGKADAWPEKKEGLWHFDLVKLKLAGSEKITLSMDYNFMLAQSAGKTDPDLKNRKFYQAQMLDTYLNYFLTNYTGNRAPLRIGHHFTDFQDGVYNQALLKFATKVCGLPEVRCVTFTQLADFMDKLDPATMQAYQQGDFPHAPPPTITH